MSGAASVGAVSVWTLQPPPPPPPPPPPMPLPLQPALSTLSARSAHESQAEVVPPARPSPGREQAAAARTLARALERSFLRPRVQAAVAGGRLWTAWLDELPQPCVEAAARMLSAHWHRSISSRVAVLSRPSGMQPATLPRSLVLCMPVGGGEMPRLIGHARLKSFRDGGPADVLLESVLVAPCGRGLGLGRLLMDRVEQQARALGFERIVLSTSDKQGFYRTLGYTIMPSSTSRLTTSPPAAGGALNGQQSAGPGTKSSPLTSGIPFYGTDTDWLEKWILPAAQGCGTCAA